MTVLAIALVVDVLAALWVRRDAEGRDWSQRKADGTGWWLTVLLLTPLLVPVYMLARPRRTTVTGPAAGTGWHPDPSGRHEMRYWDGRAWTTHVTDGGRPGSDPVRS
jgi:hypothetical protein